jgi:hypothetical protein
MYTILEWKSKDHPLRQCVLNYVNWMQWSLIIEQNILGSQPPGWLNCKVDFIIQVLLFLCLYRLLFFFFLTQMKEDSLQRETSRPSSEQAPGLCTGYFWPSWLGWYFQQLLKLEQTAVSWHWAHNPWAVWAWYALIRRIMWSIEPGYTVPLEGTC